MASSAEAGLETEVSASLQGVARGNLLFTLPASLSASGFFAPSLATVLPHFLEGNYCSWILPDTNQNIFPALQLVNKEAPAEVLKKPCSPLLEGVPGKKKRGRKPLRPQDPVRKKTEHKDKYWLRTFRAYMRQHYSLLRPAMPLQDRLFWEKHFSLHGRPCKGGQFASYSKEYKNSLFGNATFREHFERWFGSHGAAVLCGKYPRDSALWFVFYDYAASELAKHKSLSA